MTRLQDAVRPVWKILAIVAVSVFLASQVLVARMDGIRRRHRADLPRVVWGPTPIINIKYWSQSVRHLGFESNTVVHSV